MRCSVCDKVSKQVKRCGRCQKAEYCSKECQVEDWKNRGHKLACKPVEKAQAKESKVKSHQQLMFERENKDTMQGDELEQINSMIETTMLQDPDLAKESNYWFYQKCPNIHLEFKEHLKLMLPDLLEDECFKLLKTAVESAKALHLKELELVRPGSVENIQPEDLLRRLCTNHEEAIQWFFYSPPGDIRKHIDLQGDNIHHSFANFVVLPQIFRAGTTHVSVGFVDLSTLLVAHYQGSGKPVRFVGVEASVFSSAKAMVIIAMLEDQSIDIPSIFQVWFSSCWNAQTLSDFKTAVVKVLEQEGLDSQVKELLQSWESSSVVSIQEARLLWLESIDISILNPVLNATRLGDRVELMSYFLTGQLLNADCGSITMFSSSNLSTFRARDESLFHHLKITDYISLADKETSLVDAASQIVLERIINLKDAVKEKVLKIEILPPAVVSPENAEVITKIAALKPTTIAWGNIVDYMDTKVFHKLAKQCSHSKKTVHIGHSVAWRTVTKGAFALDYPTGPQFRDLLRNTRSSIMGLMNINFLSKHLKNPPLDNPINLADFSFAVQYHNHWTSHFFKGVKQLGDVEEYNYNVFLKAYNVLDLMWSY
jgi:hypothetical protein